MNTHGIKVSIYTVDLSLMTFRRLRYSPFLSTFDIRRNGFVNRDNIYGRAYKQRYPHDGSADN